MSEQDVVNRTHLPIPSKTRTGLITYDAKDPDCAFPPIEPLRPPAGAPNVLLILLDDVGFGASSAFGGPCQTPVAEWLAADDRVEAVSYAGLPSSPWHERVERLYPKGAGALFTIRLKGGYEACVAMIGRLKLISHVANLGDARTLAIHSASTTHRQLTEEQQVAAGAGPDLVRLSIGIEDPADIIADLDQALG